MKLPALIRPRDTADRLRTAAECAESIAKLEAERTAAVEQLAAMSVERLALLGDETVPVERLLDHDARAAQTAIRRDRAAVQADRLEVERQAAEVREEGERRAELYRAGQAAEKARRKLLEEEYQPTAERLAGIARKAADLAATIETANAWANRPQGAEQIGIGEQFNGVEPSRAILRETSPERWLCTTSGMKISRSWLPEQERNPNHVIREFPSLDGPTYEVPAVRAVPHRAVLTDLRLPSIRHGEPDLYFVAPPED